MPRATDSAVLERLYRTIAGRRGGDPTQSYTAKLFADGAERIAKKVAEEGVEAALAAAAGDRKALVRESADVIYHLMVAWAHARIAPSAVYAELTRREGTSGLVEKATRSVRASKTRRRKST